MRYRGRAYRAHDPRWAFKPLSGDGAAQTGGRFNRIGVPTLYLALDPLGAVIEAQTGLAGRIRPLTLCEYDIDCEDVADLTSPEGRGTHDAKLTDLAASWQEERRPASQRLADRLIAAGVAGIIVPSFAVRAEAHHHNLVLWKWGPDLPHKVTVFDPSGRLPKDQLSWR